MVPGPRPLELDSLPPEIPKVLAVDRRAWRATSRSHASDQGHSPAPFQAADLVSAPKKKIFKEPKALTLAEALKEISSAMCLMNSKTWSQLARAQRSPDTQAFKQPTSI